MVTPLPSPRAHVARRRLGIGLATLLAAVLPLAPAQAAPEPGSPGIGDGYFPIDGNGGLDVLRYDIHDRYRFREGRLSGHTTLTVRATQDLSSFHLDFLLPVRRVAVAGVPADVARPRQHELRITPSEPLAAGTRFRVRVTYDGHPGPIGYDGEKNWLADEREVVAMNQPHMAPWWFPANDHPSDKALMDISITVPRGRQVVANGNPVGRERDGALVAHHWRADEPMATYLAMFAAGSFRVERGEAAGVPSRLLVSEQLGPTATRASLRMLRQSPAVVEGLAEDLGPYPFSAAGGLVTGLPVYFALENQTMPTYFAVRRGRHVPLVVHEQAHQWFGDSVAIERWRDIWLNEGAATFMEHRWTETHGGPDAAQWLQDEYDARGPGSRFWRMRIADPGHDGIFATPVYLRGGMAFQALRNRIGEDDFWLLLQTWLRDNEGGNASTGDFETLAAEVSGESLDGFFDAWLHTGERPARTADNGLA